MALIQTLAPDPGAELAAQAQLMRQQKLAQLLANPPAAPEIDMGGGGRGGDKGSSPEGNSILAKALSEDVAKTAGPSVAAFDAPVLTGSAPISIPSAGNTKAHYSLNDDQRRELSTSIRATAQNLGVSPEHVAAIMSFETGGTLNPWQPGPRTKWGQHHGLIQWGEPQAKQYGVGPNSSIADQVAAAGRYLTDHGVRPGMGLNNLYSAVLHGNANSGLDVTDANGTSANSGAANMLRTAHINALANLERGFGGQSQAPQTAPAETPYRVASLGYTPVPHRQPIAPMQPPPAPSPQPAPPPTATPPVPPIPTMVGAPMPTTSTPISPTAGASLTDAPLPPSRSASGVDDMIKRQAAAARPAFTEPEGFDLFDEIGRGLEELFGGGGDTGVGGPSPQQLGTQLASAGEEYYPMPPSNSHGILGLISDAFREPVPIPPEVRALNRSPKQSDRLAYELMVHGDQLGGTQASMLQALYKEAREREQAQQNRFGPEQVDQFGNVVQIGPNGQVHMLRAAERPQARQTATVDGNVIDTQTGQVIYSAPQKPQTPVHVGDALVDPTTGREVYRAPANPQNDPYESTRAKQRAEMDALEDNANRLGLQGDERRQYILSGGKSVMQDEKTTAEQGNAASFATRMREADKIISDPNAVAQTKGFKGAAQAIEGSLPVIGNFLVSDDYQRLDQAQRDFINATLRRESGASISPSEFENAKKQYFPQPGDSEPVLAQKMRNRQTAMEGIAAGGAPGFRQSFFGERNPNIVERADRRSSAPAQNTSKPTQIFKWLPDGTLQK